MRGFFRTLIAGTAVVAIAGCSDSATSPSEATSRSVAPGDRPSLDYSGPRFGGYRTSTFTLTAAGGTFTLGDGLYTLAVPANAVCTLNSSYGPGTWDSPCSTLHGNQSITVTATYGFAQYGPVVDFSPELRFNPNTTVKFSSTAYASILTAFHNYFAANTSALRFFGIYYVPTLGAKVVTDVATDPSLVTHVNLSTGVVWRRIKHFSGYNVATGLECNLGEDGCVTYPPVVDQP